MSRLDLLAKGVLRNRWLLIMTKVDVSYSDVNVYLPCQIARTNEEHSRMICRVRAEVLDKLKPFKGYL